MINIIDTEELKKKIDNKEDFVLVDVLGENSYEMWHIPGSVNVPNGPDFLERFEKTGALKDKEIITCCASATCMASVRAAEVLEKAGYANVGHYKEGIVGWQNAGFRFEGEAVRKRKMYIAGAVFGLVSILLLIGGAVGFVFLSDLIMPQVQMETYDVEKGSQTINQEPELQNETNQVSQVSDQEREPQIWGVDWTQGLKDTLNLAVHPGDSIAVAKGWLELPDTPTDFPADLTIFGEGPSETLLIGQMRLSEGSVVRDISLFNNRSSGPVIQTHGSVDIANVVVSGRYGRIDMGSSPQGWEYESAIQVSGSIFIGRDSTLNVDVRHQIDYDLPAIRNNVFVGQECAIQISDAVVFGYVPSMERVEVWVSEIRKSAYAEALEQNNVFVNVNTPVCFIGG